MASPLSAVAPSLVPEVLRCEPRCQSDPGDASSCSGQSKDLFRRQSNDSLPAAHTQHNAALRLVLPSESFSALLNQTARMLTDTSTRRRSSTTTTTSAPWARSMSRATAAFARSRIEDLHRRSTRFKTSRTTNPRTVRPHPCPSSHEGRPRNDLGFSWDE